MNYFEKMRGVTKSPPRVNLFEMVWSWIGAFAGIAAVAYINYHFLSETDLVMVIGSFGACVGGVDIRRYSESARATTEPPWWPYIISTYRCDGI